jgi:hypothetical protein
VKVSILFVVAGVVLGGGLARAAGPSTAECLAASESSLALRRAHKLAEARSQLLICAAAACPADVRDECLGRLKSVNAAMPGIVFEAKDAAGNDLAAVRVVMDGHPLAERLDGSALAVDPGEHAFVFSAPGQPTVKKAFVIHEWEKDRRERIAFGAPAPASTPETRPVPVVAAPSGAPDTGEASAGLGTRRILAIVAAGVGVVGVGVGIGFGLASRSKHSQAEGECSSSLSQCPTQAGSDLWHQAVVRGTISTVGFVAGGVAVAAGAALWFTAKPRKTETAGSATTEVGLGPGTLQVRGTW